MKKVRYALIEGVLYNTMDERRLAGWQKSALRELKIDLVSVFV